MRKRPSSPRVRSIWKVMIAVLCLAATMGYYVASSPTKAGATAIKAAKFGSLDCNGQSPIQRPLKIGMLCTDIRGFPNVHNAFNHNGRFWDNGMYIGHDEPDVTFNSSMPGSGDNVTWSQTIGPDPTKAMTVKTPGSDVTHYVELTPAPWTSMAICDSNSYPQLPCKAESDSNAPACAKAFGCPTDVYPGGGGAFMEMQLYPPGIPPFQDSISCDNTHWCAALTIDSLECTYQFAQCNTACEEPVNFGFIQKNGVPTGPPSPQNGNLASREPNNQTLLLNPGDKITIHEWDAPVPGEKGVKALEVKIDDLTTKQSGFMQASAVNGFENTSIATCEGTPYNFQPMYNTAARNNIVGWTALQTNISNQFEIGHFEPCTSLTGATLIDVNGFQDRTYLTCHGPYESSSDGSGSGEPTDGLCYYKGDTHFFFASQPDQVTGCQDNLTQNGDLDFDGTPYWPDWPTAATATTTPASFVDTGPSTGGKQYSSFFFQTDVALSESTCGGSSLSGCTVPPSGPGKFYPYWSEVNTGGKCTWEFGNVAGTSSINAFGKDKQYGTDQVGTLGYPEFEGKSINNTCPAAATKA